MDTEQALLRAAALETIVPEASHARLDQLLHDKSLLDPASDGSILHLRRRDLLFIGNVISVNPDLSLTHS